MKKKAEKPIAPWGYKADGTPYKRKPPSTEHRASLKANAKAGGRKKHDIYKPPASEKMLTAREILKKHYGPNYDPLIELAKTVDHLKKLAEEVDQGQEYAADAKARITNMAATHQGTLAKYCHPQLKAMEVKGRLEGMVVKIDMRKQKK